MMNRVKVVSYCCLPSDIRNVKKAQVIRVKGKEEIILLEVFKHRIPGFSPFWFSFYTQVRTVRMVNHLNLPKYSSHLDLVIGTIQ